MPDGTLVFDTKIDTDGFAQGTKQLESASNKLGDVFKGSFLGNFAANIFSNVAGKLTDFAKTAIDVASDLSEVQNVVDVTFGANTDTIERFAKSAMTNFGLTELQAKQYSSTIGATLKSMGLTDKELIKISTDMTGLVGDMASFYNLDHDTAFQKIRSGLSGETEPLKQLGINLSVANLNAYALAEGLGKTYEQMSEAERVNLRFGYIMQATADAQGDFVRTSDGYANQVRILQGNITNIAAAIGESMIPFLEEALRLINSLFAGPPENKLLTEIDAISESLDGINEKVGSARGAYTIETVRIELDYEDALTGLEKIDEIKGQIASGEVSEEEGTDAIKAITDEIVAMYPELERYVDAKSGLFKKGTDKIQEEIAKQRDQLLLQASDTYRGEAQTIYEEAVADYTELLPKYQEAVDEWEKTSRKAAALDAISAAQFGNRNNTDALNSAVDAINAYVDAYGGLEGIDPNKLDEVLGGTDFLRGGKVSEDLVSSDADIAAVYGLLDLIYTSADESIYAEKSAAETALDKAEATIQSKIDDVMLAAENLQSMDSSNDYIAEAQAIIDKTTGAVGDGYASGIADGAERGVNASLAVLGSEDTLNSFLDMGVLQAEAQNRGYESTLRVGKGEHIVLDPYSTDGSHATGLNRVPYDGYLARLHAGEAVLNAADAEVWRRSKGGIDYGSMAAAIASAMPTGGAAPTVRLYVDGKELASSQAANNRTALAARSVTEARGYGKR